MIENLKSTNDELSEKLSEVTGRYVSCRCSQLGLNESLVTNTIREEMESSDIDAIEDSLMESYRSKKSISRQSPNNSLVDSLVPKKVKISRSEFATGHDESLLESNHITKDDQINDIALLSEICSAVKSGQVKQLF